MWATFVLAFSLLFGARSQAEGPEWHIQTRDGAEVTSGGNKDIPPPRIRDKIFKEAHLTTDLRGWDQLARDNLLLAARFSTSEQLAKAYPKLSQKKLLTLRKICAHQWRERRP